MPRKVCIVLALISCVLCSVTQAQTLNLKQRTLLSKADNAIDKTIAVIVRLKPSTTVSSGSDWARSKLSNENQKGQSKHSLRKDITKFKHAPLAAMSVNSDELVTLMNDPDLEIYEDTIKWPSLSQSVNSVYPSRNISPFHGDNDWAVAILDTGVDKSHPFLNNKVVAEACYSNAGALATTSSLCPGGVSSSTAVGSGVNCSLSFCQHGTQVAGIAAGNGASFDGVARDAKLISIQIYSEFMDESVCGLGVASCVGAYTSDIISGLEHVYDLRNSFNIAAVNLSLGSSELFTGSCDDQPEQPIIDQLTAAGIAVVAASGNSGNTSQMQSPACITNAIAVAATSRTNNSAWVGNNISNQLDLFAPGIAITSSAPNGLFQAGTGTSFAAPHVAGAWAAMKHADPDLSVSAGEALLKNSGPVITQHSVSRRRLSLTPVLNSLVPGSQSNPSEPSPPRIPRPLNGDAAFLPAVIFLLGDDS